MFQIRNKTVANFAILWYNILKKGRTGKKLQLIGYNRRREKKRGVFILRNKKRGNFSEMINKIKNSDSITNRIVANVNMLINPKKFESSNITRLYKNFYGAQKTGDYNKSLIKPSRLGESLNLGKLNKNADRIIKGIGGVYFHNTYGKNQEAEKNSGGLVYQNERGSYGFILNKKDYKSNISKNSLNYFMDKTFYKPTEKVFGGIKEVYGKTAGTGFNSAITRGIRKNDFKNTKEIFKLEGNGFGNIKGNFKSEGNDFRNVKENFKLRGNDFRNVKGNSKSGVNGGLNKIIQGKTIGGNIFGEAVKSVNIGKGKGIGEKIFKDMKGVLGEASKRRAENSMAGNVSPSILNRGGKNIFDFPTLPAVIERGEKSGKDFKGFKFKDKISSKSGEKSISEKTAGGINVSPNINVEINQKNSLRDFNKIWEEIGGRLMDEINSSVSGYH